jgi:DNA-binding transcriptional regulator YiaG
MGNRTGRKVIASKDTQNRAVSIKKSNPEMSNAQIAQRLGVTARQVQYWLAKSAKGGA